MILLLELIIQKLYLLEMMNEEERKIAKTMSDYATTEKEKIFKEMKVSNLLNVEKKLAPQMKQVLERSGISHYLLLESEDKATFLVYREDGLKAYLMQDRVCQSMKSFGYESLDLNDVLSCFQKRYADCMEQIAEFPHEMGLLLGYPVEDVEGFIENKGHNYLYAGYWKVYGHVEEKKALFNRYEEARKVLIQLLASGRSVSEMAACYA